MRILLRTVIVLLILISTNNSVLAKSLDITEFNKLWKQAHKLKEEGKINEASHIFLSIGESFDIDNFNASEQHKGAYYYWICSASNDLKMPGEPVEKKRTRVGYCSKTYNYLKKSDVFEDKDNLVIAGNLFLFLADNYLDIFTISGGDENLRLAKKYNAKLLEYVDKMIKGPAKSNFTVNVLSNLINLYRLENNIEESIRHEEQLISFLKCGGNQILDGYNKKRIEVQCNREKYNLAHLKSISGKDEEARRIFEEVIKEETDNIHPADKAITRLSLYTLYRKRGDFDEAEKYLYESLSFLNPENPTHIHQYYNNLMHLYSFLSAKGFIHEAIEGYLDLIKIIEEKEGSNAVQLIDPLSNLSRQYSNIKKYNKALQHQKHILNILKNNKTYQLGLTVVYADMGAIHMHLKNFKEAEKYFAKSIQIKKKRKDYVNAVPIIISMAKVKIELSEYQEAKDLLKEAESINFKYHENDPGNIIGIYTEYIDLYSKTNKIEKYNESLVKLYSTISNYSKGISSSKFNFPITLYTGRILKFVDLITGEENNWYLKSDNFFKSKTDKKIDNAVIELFEIVRGSKINRSVQNVVDRNKDSKIAKEKKKLQNLIIEYEKIPKSSSDPKEKKEIFEKLKLTRKEISEQKEVILSKLNISALSNFSQEILIEDIQKEITNDQVIVSYFFSELWIYIHAITRQDVVLKKISNKDKNIKQLITQIRKTLKIKGMQEIPKFDLSSSKKLYDSILGPVSNILEDKNELIIIPHEELMSLPFEVLIDQSIDHGYGEKDYSKVNWLGKKYAISYYPSIYSFYNLQKIKFKKVKNDFVGLGDPLLVAKKNKPKDIDYTELFTRGVANAEEIRNMEELPETAGELQSIAKIFKGKSKLYLREDFNEKVVKTIDLNNYKIISFATHAVIANEINNIAEPGLILTPPDKPTKLNDGILTVSEVEKLNLQSDIVILSACNTAAKDGSPNAGGLSGLASAFFQAGTKSILVTHWDVETNSAVKLTTGMFDKMQKTNNLSQALHLSKMDILNTEETSHPLFWAPYVLIGNVTQAIN